MSTKEKIMDTAEAFIRTRGFNSFSFRDIATEIGIKSASVHYHFGTKDDLGVAVTERYIDAVTAVLGNPLEEIADKETLAERFITLYRHALMQDAKLCLCGMLGAEIDSLSETVQAPVRRFFTRQIDWLESMLARFNPNQDISIVRARARSTVGALQGALMMARALDDVEVFEDVAARIKLGLTH